MSLKVRYFASLKDWVGRDQDCLQLGAPMSARQAWQLLNPELALPSNVLAAVNMDFVELDAVVKDGDELAFFPPVTGG